MFTLIQSSPLEVTFDPVFTEERLPSVAFDITANWVMPYQQAQIIIKECWVEHSELNRFESQLKQLINKQLDNVKLSNMSLEPIIQFSRNSDKVIFEFVSIDTGKMGTVSIKTNLYEQELTEIIQNIKNWGKWW
jgi:hypothetical protein